MPSARHRALAAASPTSSEPARPGVLATATASICVERQIRPVRSASSMTGRIRSTCAREAISGTTPPKRSCRWSCEATTDERTSSSSVDDGGRRFVAGGFENQEFSSIELRGQWSHVDGARQATWCADGLAQLQLWRARLIGSTISATGAGLRRLRGRSVNGGFVGLGRRLGVRRSACGRRRPASSGLASAAARLRSFVGRRVYRLGGSARRGLGGGLDPWRPDGGLGVLADQDVAVAAIVESAARVCRPLSLTS